MPPDRRTIGPDHRPGSFGDQLQLCNLARAHRAPLSAGFFSGVSGTKNAARAFSYAGDAAFDTSSAVCLRSPLSTMPAGIIVPAFPQRSPPRHLIAAACGGLRSTPDCRPRRALLHLSYSYASPCGPALLVTQDPEETSGLRLRAVTAISPQSASQNFSVCHSCQCDMMAIVGCRTPIGKRSAHRICHRAPRKPVRERANVGGRSIQLYLLPPQCLGQGHTAQPNSIKRQNVGRNENIDVEAGVLETNRDVRALDEQPIALPRPAAEVELDHHAASANGFDAHSAAHP